MNAQLDLLPGQPLPQTDYQIVPVTIRELCEQRERFNVNPEYQRENVWKRSGKQQLIDCILLGRGIGLLTGYKCHEMGRTLWEIMDGQQRILAILGFVDNEYKTWTPAIKRRMQPITKSGPVQEGKYFEQMPEYVRDYLLDYHVYIGKIPEMSVEERIEEFICLNTQVSLTPAERLQVYPSKANAAAKHIVEHTFWEDFYIGQKNRKQLFLSSLYLLGLQLTPGGIVDLRAGTFIPALASGKFDHEITDEVVTAVQDRLDAVSCVYAGMQFTDRAASIAMYQTIIFLEQAGCSLQSLTHHYRKLADWLSEEIESSKRASGLPLYHRPIQSLLYKRRQQEFWEKHRKTVLSLIGLN